MLVFEDGKRITDYNGYLWDGLFSRAHSNGKMIEYVKSCLPDNSIMVIPKSDGNITNNKKYYNDVNWEQIQQYNNPKKVFMIGTLSQVEEENYNYIYLPLDDIFFTNGVTPFFRNNPKWEDRSSKLCWRGSCSGVKNGDSLRRKFVKKIYDYDPNTDIRLCKLWSEGVGIPEEYFADRLPHIDFLKHKIFFIVDGNCIASNHMYGFATGCVPFLISNARCWFQDLIVPFVHYIPIAYDLSNLIEQIEWVNNNDEKAKQIAENAYNFAETYFSSEYQQKYIKESIEKCCKKKQIIDCFIFYNELDILYYRLIILYDIVDKFVIVEANQTFSGNPKKLFYEENKHLFKRFEDKIIHIVVDLPHVYPMDYSKNAQWENEYYQRNCITKGIDRLNDNDLIIISDLDEIPDPTTLLQIKNGKEMAGITLVQDMYYYNLNTKHELKWISLRIVTYKYYLTTTPQKIRETKDFPRVENGGWHLSYFGDKEFIKNKIKSFSHQEYNYEEYTNEEVIENKIKNNQDLFNRSYVPCKYISTEDNKYLPPLYDKYLLNYIDNKRMPIYIYFHICCINNWKTIVSNLLFKIKNSGLYNIVKEIRCVILGDYDGSLNDPKIKIIFQSPDISLYEKVTINLLYNDAIKEEFKVLYIHSKGVNHFNRISKKNVYDWSEYMCYFNMYHFNTCLNELNSCDAIGVNLQIKLHEYPLHYSGNFWWSKSSHICKLKLIQDNYYNSPEFWITSIKGKYKSLWNSDTHHYNDSYPPHMYENKNIKIHTMS